jgi:hypothetical protein
MLFAGGRGDLPPAKQAPAPSQHAPADVVKVDAEDFVDAQVAPHLRQFVDPLLIRFLPGGEECGVDTARGDAGKNVGNRLGEFPRNDAKHADLIRASCSAAAQNQG